MRRKKPTFRSVAQRDWLKENKPDVYDEFRRNRPKGLRLPKRITKK